MPELTTSTVTVPDPAVIASNPAWLPGNTSVTVSTGTHTPRVGVGVGVGVGEGVGVGDGVRVGPGPGNGEHCALIRTALDREDVLRVKSTA